jgi:hypothetical protein
MKFCKEMARRIPTEIPLGDHTVKNEGRWPKPDAPRLVGVLETSWLFIVTQQPTIILFIHKKSIAVFVNATRGSPQKTTSQEALFLAYRYSARETPKPDAPCISTPKGRPSRPLDEYHGAIRFKHPLGVHVAEKLDQLGHRPRPPRLMARAKS